MIELGLTPVSRHDETGCEGATCTCGEGDAERVVLDVRLIPHAIRHAAVFGALNSLAPMASMDIVANHDPVPLRAQLEQQSPGLFSVDYITSGPDEWILRFGRR